MRSTLTLHPDAQCPAIERIDVDVARPSSSVLELRYRMIGRLTAIVLPALVPPTRADDLWRHTCFEAFLRAVPGSGYRELNFAPSSQWAAYSFDGYREGIRTADPESLDIQVARGDGFELAARLTLDLPATPWQVGLSAVVEQIDGTRSYWALAHPPGKADFHHPDGFALELPAETQR